MQWYNKQWAKTTTSVFDKRFKPISELTWLPWVGKKYELFKVLVIAESHYVNTNNPKLVSREKSECMTDPLFTRKVMAEYPLLGYDAGWENHAGRCNNPTFDNISRVLCGKALLNEEEREDRYELWSRVAFMNFIQRPMWYSNTHGKERPLGDDRTNGWKATLAVIRVLKPVLCIFAGLEATIWFDWYMKENGVTATTINFHKKLGRCAPRSASIKVNGMDVAFRFMRHPGSYFSWQPWRKFVFDGKGDLLSMIEDL